MKKETIETQFGISSEADFENYTWTFQMPKKYSVAAGEFALVDKILYDQLIDSLEQIINTSTDAPEAMRVIANKALKSLIPQPNEK